MDVLGIPGELGPALYAIVGGSFLAAVSNAAFSTGGAMIVLAVTSTVLPASMVVPLHSTLLIGSTASRALVFRRHVDWKIAGPFLVGSVVAVAIGARIYFTLPESVIGTAIALVMLVAIWLPGMPSFSEPACSGGRSSAPWPSPSPA